MDLAKEDHALRRWKDKLPEVAAPSHLQFSADNTMIKTLTRDYRGEDRK